MFFRGSYTQKQCSGKLQNKLLDNTYKLLVCIQFQQLNMLYSASRSYNKKTVYF